MGKVKVGFSAGTSPPVGRIDAVLLAARLFGFDSFWTIDHFQSFFNRGVWQRDFTWLASPRHSPHEILDYQVMLGHLARRAGNLQLAVGVTEPIRRHPVLLAQSFMTLSHLVKRPPILGIGSGEAENVRPYGLDFSRPVARLEEALQIIRLCFDSQGPFDYEGDFYRLEGAVMDLRPALGRTPEVWLAAHGPRMLELTGRYGDGWFPVVPMTPADYEDRLVRIRKSAAEVGRDPEKITAGLSLYVIAGKTEGEARRLLHHRSVRYLALLVPDYVWKKYGVTHPLGDGFRGMVDFVPEQYSTADLEEMMSSVPLDLMEEPAAFGTPRQLLEKLHSFREAGLQHVVLVPVSGLISRRDAVYGIRTILWLSRRLRAG
ncbi:MAG TPA: LLM class flavin-dependent oxidoreductase [Acidimicrobiia bacterium]